MNGNINGDLAKENKENDKNISPLDDITFIPSEKSDEKDLGKETNNSIEDFNPYKKDLKPVSFYKLYRYSTWKDKTLIMIGILCAVVTGLSAPVHTLIFGDLADAMIKYGSAIAGGGILDKDGFLTAIQDFAVNNSIIGIVMLICSYISITTFNHAAHSQIFRIRGIFFRSALNQDIAYYDFNQSGEFASRMNEDLSKMEEGLGEKVVMFIHYLVAFSGSLILAFIKGWELALVCLSSLPITFIAMGIVSVITSRLAKREMDEYGKAGSIAEEVLSSIRTVIAFGGQEKEVTRYKSNLFNAKLLNIRKSFFAGIGFGLLWFFIYASYALAFWYGIGLVVDQRHWDKSDIIYTPGVMLVVFFSVMTGSMNLGMASPYIEVFGTAKGAGSKVFDLIETIPKINPLFSSGSTFANPIGNIQFRDIYFQYPSRPHVKVLEGLNLSINRGETVALVGSSGCGKSTCIQLLQRFYDPAEGQIELDGVDIKQLDINWLRERIGVVGQEPILFGTTIYENIRYGYEDATKDEIINAAKAANAHNFVIKLPKAYETLVGERGAQLSGGQKQRIAIARALVRNPEILLLDEATSALDTASEAKVQNALERASEGRTTIIIAHRLSTIRGANKIVVIHEGKVVETGTHNVLMVSKGYYYNLVTAQIGDQNEERIRTPSISGEQSSTTILDEDENDIDYIYTDLETDTIKDKKQTPSLLEILKLNKTEWPHILAGSISSIIMGFAMPLFAILFGDIMNILAQPDDDAVRDETNIYSLYFVLAGIAVGMATFLQIYLFGIAGEKLTERLRENAFSSMVKQEIAWFDNKENGTGSLCARLSNDAAAVQGATGQRIGIILQSLATLFLGVGLAIYYEWKLGLLAFVFTPFILMATYLQRSFMVKQALSSAKTMEECTKLAVEVVSNIRTVVSLGRERMFYDKYIELLTPSVREAQRSTHYRGFIFGLARSLMFFAFAACMFYGGYLVANEDLNFAKVFKVSQALIMGTVAIANALAFAPNFQKGVIAAGKILDLFNRTPAIRDASGTSRDMNWKSEGNVRYEKILFNYPSRPHVSVLNGLSMAINKGQTIALVGPSGCGKSTCIQLLLRFYDTNEGTVSIDERDVKTLSLRNLREQLGTVSQEPTLFDRTIMENIAYGDNTREVNEMEIIEAAKNANIHNFITSLPSGYETRLGEKGTQLSGGQKQRIAIARALVRNPRVLLLDEATSALDTESEKIVQEALDAASQGRTCITIAHRLSTIIDADIIFVLDGGNVVEQGTHKELLEQHGLYYKLYKLQSRARSKHF